MDSEIGSKTSNVFGGQLETHQTGAKTIKDIQKLISGM